MKNEPISDTEVQLTRWLDNMPGAMPPENLDPQAGARLRADANAVAELLRKHVPISVEPPYPDFFNSQVLKKIRDEHNKELSTTTESLWATLGAWLRSPWMAAAATAAVVVTAIATLEPRAGADLATGTRVLSVFSPEPNATARVLSASDQDAVIITVDGLDPFPSDRLVAGLLDDGAQHSLVAALLP